MNPWHCDVVDSFAWRTCTERWPRIIDGVADDVPDHRVALARLREEVTDGVVLRLHDDNDDGRRFEVINDYVGRPWTALPGTSAKAGCMPASAPPSAGGTTAAIHFVPPRPARRPASPTMTIPLLPTPSPRPCGAPCGAIGPTSRSRPPVTTIGPPWATCCTTTVPWPLLG